MKTIIQTLFRRSVVPVVCALTLLVTTRPASGIIDINLQMQLGNPSSAGVDTNNHNNFLIKRTVDAVDFSDNLGGPTWVAWDLTSADMGSAPRSTTFTVDTNIPSNFYRVTSADYTGSGYDRGHNCPSADRTDTSANNKLVFFMSNITPQAPDLNQGPWVGLESYCRTLAGQGNELLIQCGAAQFNGTTIQPSGKAAIGTYNWKIIVVVPPGGGSALSRITSTTRVITVKMPNIAGIRNVSWASYVTNAAQIETDTGYTFFTALDGTTAAALRAKVDNGAGALSPANHVTISQVYGGGGNSGAPYLNKFVELYNPTTNVVDLSTWAIQYASASGSSWTAGNLSGTIWPDDYYLIQMASGGANGVALPQASTTNAINPAATAGKFALTKTQTTLSGTNPLTNTNIVDFIGYGSSASAYEGSGYAPAPSNTKSDFRNGDGLFDADDNANDFYTATPIPRSSYAPPPTISGFTPGSGSAGDSVTITGTALDTAETVKFNGTAATFTGGSSTQIVATVPAGATTGSISVTTHGGTATSAGTFTFIPAAISSFTPTNGGLNVSVTITGTGFTGATVVEFNGTSAGYTVNSATQITASVPAGATTGTISVTAPGGVATSAGTFTVTGGVTVSQIYGGGGNTGAPYLNDFIELYNWGTQTINLNTWAVQYAAATGSSWSVTPLTGSIAPGAHYLIKEASGGGVGAALPTPQVTGSINLSATAGKVALTATQTALSGTNPLPNGNIVDFVGYGSTASAYEGSGPTSAPSNTTADFRANGGATDTDNNAGDFSTAAPNPRNN